jgi:hypothetical protein
MASHLAVLIPSFSCSTPQTKEKPDLTCPASCGFNSNFLRSAPQTKEEHDLLALHCAAVSKEELSGSLAVEAAPLSILSSLSKAAGKQKLNPGKGPAQVGASAPQVARK